MLPCQRSCHERKKLLPVVLLSEERVPSSSKTAQTGCTRGATDIMILGNGFSVISSILFLSTHEEEGHEGLRREKSLRREQPPLTQRLPKKRMT